MKVFPSLLLALCLGIAGAQANPPALRGGYGAPVAAPAFAIDSSGVRVDHRDGQTFVQWPDALSAASSTTVGACNTNDAPGRNTRYRVYRSTSPITSGNYTSASKIASYVLYNSAQLPGGNPDTSGGFGFTPANRQCSTSNFPMMQIPDAQLGGLRTLSFSSGLQAYTALGSATAYYAVVSTDTSDASPNFIGSVGPIAESVAPQVAIQIKHRTTGGGQILTSTTGLAVVLSAHGSLTGGGGVAGTASSNKGDYWEWFGDTTEGWQDGQPRMLEVQKDGIGQTLNPSLLADTGDVVLGLMDNIWNSTGTAGITGAYGAESWWWGLGLIPNPLVPTTGSVGTGRFYPTTENAIKKQIKWLNTNYSIDLNKLHWGGDSMGAFGGIRPGMHMKSPLDPTKPMFASIMVSHPVFRWDLAAQWQGYWPGGGSFWGGTTINPWPFSATAANGSATLGTNPAAILMNDGASWLAKANSVTFLGASPGDELPFLAWQDAKDDVELAAGGGAGGFQQIIDAVAALQTAHRGHATNWYMGLHDTGSPGMGTISCDRSSGTIAIPAGCYNRSSFRLDRAYIAFDHSSIDDNPGTGARTGPGGTYDGDVVGVINAGFAWNVTSDTVGAFNFTAGNNWMGRSRTLIPTNTISSTMTSSGTTCPANCPTIADATGFATLVGGYFLVGTEAVRGTIAGSTLTVTARALFGTTVAAHSVGETIIQYPWQATGPNGGPYATMTANMTPRFVQSFKPANGTVLNCTITPFGAGATTQTPTVTNGIFTLNAVTINSGGNTSVSCI